jgi:alpha-L-rhamnosidase
MLEDNYEGMKEYVRYMKTWVNKDGIMFSQRKGSDGKPLKWFNLGDWVGPGEMASDELVHTFYFWRCADLTAKSAEALNKLEEAKEYADLANKTKEAFYKRFYDAENGTYGNGGGNIFALKMGVPNNQKDKVITSLKANIKVNDGHFDTGIFGTQFFFEILSENGMHELAYEALTKKTEPSFGHWLEQGATTTWEQWDGTNSRNYPMFGGGLVWLYRKLAGMNADPKQPGYRHIIFKPQLIDDLDFVTYSNNTPYGKARITWKKKEGKYAMDITVPVGSKATIYVPTDDISKLKESGKSIDQVKEIKIKSTDKNEVVLHATFGVYHFEFLLLSD